MAGGGLHSSRHFLVEQYEFTDALFIRIGHFLFLKNSMICDNRTGTRRLSLPIMQAHYRQERDEYIHRKFNDQNDEELPRAFGLAKSLVRRIVNDSKT